MSEDQRKILIVDDEEMIRNVVVRILKIKNHNTIEAISGEVALNILSDTSDIDYVILDLSMPGKYSGEEIFGIIREKYPKIKVIISSGFIDPRKRAKFDELGVTAILEKPYKIEDILGLIN